MWPFFKKQRFPGIKQKNDGTIEFSLTDDEAREANLALQAWKGSLVHPEFAEKVRNGTIAVALSHYAQRLVMILPDVNTQSELKSNWPTIQVTLEKAIAAVWKSYSLCPLPVFLYHRAGLLKMLGLRDEARQLYASFLKKQFEFKMDQADKSLLDYEGTDIEYALSCAKQEF